MINHDLSDSVPPLIVKVRYDRNLVPANIDRRMTMLAIEHLANAEERFLHTVRSHTANRNSDSVAPIRHFRARRHIGVAGPRFHPPTAAVPREDDPRTVGRPGDAHHTRTAR